MRFTVQAPDGRRITLEGDKAPTEQELNDIFGYSGKQSESLADKYGADALAKIKERNAEYERQAEAKTPWLEKTGGSKAERLARDLSRQGVLVAQGISNAGLNPAGYAARAFGIDTQPMQARNGAERAAELIGQYGYDTAAVATGLNGLASAGVGGNGLTGNIIKTMAQGGVPRTLAESTGGALLTGYLNPQNQYARMLTDAIGAVAGGGAFGKLTMPKANVSKQTQKAINRLQKVVNSESLDNAMAEAERTGRSVLEVGDDAVLQAAQQARQQTPQARKVLTDYLNDALSEQTQRTRGVIDENLGTQGKYATVGDIMDAAKREAQPIYNELETLGDVAKYETKDIPEQNFKRWFEGSQVVDENGQPLKLYHGTSSKFDKFKKGKTFFVNDKGIAEQYGSEDVVEAYLNMKNPYVIDAYGQSFDEIYNAAGRKKAYKDLTETDYKKLADTFFDGDIQEAKEWFPKDGIGEVSLAKAYGDKARSTNEWADWAKKQGYDGVIIKDVNDTPDISNTRATDYIVFEPNQIKSVNNSGAWSSSPSLTDAGWMPESKMANLVKENDVVADAINKVKHSYSSLKNLPDTDAKVLLEARKLLSKQTISNDPTLAYQAKSALSEFDPVFNDITGGKLTQANKIYSDAHKFQEAADLGRDVFNNRQSVEEFKQKMKELTRNEKKAVTIGLRDEMVNRLGAASNENVANKKFLVENTRQKLKAVVGEKQGDQIIDEAEQAVKLYKNANQVLSGSQTAEKTGLRDKLTGLRRLVRNPWDTVTDFVAAPFDTRANIRTAEALTNKNLPNEYKQMQLRQALQQMQTPRISWTPYLLATEELRR